MHTKIIYFLTLIALVLGHLYFKYMTQVYEDHFSKTLNKTFRDYSILSSKVSDACLVLCFAEILIIFLYK